VRERPSPCGELKCPSEPACATRRPTGPNRSACQLIPVCPPPPVNVSTLIMMHDAEMILVSTCIDSEPVDARATMQPGTLATHTPPLVVPDLSTHSHSAAMPHPSMWCSPLSLAARTSPWSPLPCPAHPVISCGPQWSTSRDLEILTPCTDRCPCAPALSPHPMQHACSLAAPVHYRALPISSREH
jgi:hypothetical protein